jgi:hypothetical protein
MLAKHVQQALYKLQVALHELVHLVGANHSISMGHFGAGFSSSASTYSWRQVGVVRQLL